MCYSKVEDSLLRAAPHKKNLGMSHPLQMGVPFGFPLNKPPKKGTNSRKDRPILASSERKFFAPGDALPMCWGLTEGGSERAAKSSSGSLKVVFACLGASEEGQFVGGSSSLGSVFWSWYPPFSSSHSGFKGRPKAKPESTWRSNLKQDEPPEISTGGWHSQTP